MGATDSNRLINKTGLQPDRAILGAVALVATVAMDTNCPSCTVFHH